MSEMDEINTAMELIKKVASEQVFRGQYGEEMGVKRFTTFGELRKEHYDWIDMKVNMYIVAIRGLRWFKKFVSDATQKEADREFARGQGLPVE